MLYTTVGDEQEGFKGPGDSFFQRASQSLKERSARSQDSYLRAGLRSQGQGRRFAFGRARGPVGIPVGVKIRQKQEERRLARRRPGISILAKKVIARRDVKTLTNSHLIDQLKNKRWFLQEYLRTPPERKPGLVSQVRKVKKDISKIKEEIDYRKYFTEHIPGVTPEELPESLRDKFRSPRTFEFKEKRVQPRPEKVVTPEDVVTPEEVAEEKKSMAVPAAVIGTGLLVKLLFF